MKTADKLLLDLTAKHSEELKNFMQYRDIRILLSLSKSVTSDSFITENQGKLLIKIFKENQKVLQDLHPDISEIIDNPTWSTTFRPVDRTKKVYITRAPDDTQLITIEFAFSSEIRKKVQGLAKSVSNLINVNNGKLYYADLSEKNIVAIYDQLEPLGFSFEETLKNFYDTIKSWDKNVVKSQFDLTNITHDNFQKQITNDLGINTALDQNIISDRSVRYQYFHEKSEKLPENLTEKISTRESTRVWINRKTTSLDEIFESLNQLKRFPTMIVFDTMDSKNCVKEMAEISEILEKNGISDNVGIYFRMNNDENGKEFNNLIKEKSYNSELTEATQIVGVQSGKIPKFLLKSNWKPMSVISIGTVLRHSKTAVYASCCDLIITYTEKEPIIEQKAIWE